MTDKHAEAFAEFDRDHPEVWRVFEYLSLRYCRAAKALGQKRVSARMIWELMRAETIVGDLSGKDYKLNNNYAPFYSRQFRESYPQFADLIETREREGEPEDQTADLFVHANGQTSLYPEEEPPRFHE